MEFVDFQGTSSVLDQKNLGFPATLLLPTDQLDFLDKKNLPKFDVACMLAAGDDGLGCCFGIPGDSGGAPARFKLFPKTANKRRCLSQ